ncbi:MULTISPECIES: DUF2218 domain-containing protein [unclassified Corynebacterium]|uniref:DUF2218 domain-containing protein n=1 Tax=unclassified Corynebacterium TaxID=2624378 RepID=UPI0029C9D035|nr:MULTISPECIES: DUF2218 domain-containing protein [unclassified Corynebacterium]WPF66934.1 DUF2218 domain-containing protein [Corynebacterium sp. 22KM0430]WPF69422.1 DUF2218 domain-containing protein [Corynebacterium sp. 21KM1197]
MTSSTARVSTDRPARYAKQMADHFGRKITAHWDEGTGQGALIFDNPERPVRGEVSLVAGEGVLLMHLESETEEQCATLEKVVAIHLVRFGRKDELAVRWRRAGGEEGSAWGVEDLD